MIPEIRQDIRSRKKISGHSDRVLAQNFDTVLAGIVIWAGDIIFAYVCQERDADSGTQVHTFL